MSGLAGTVPIALLALSIVTALAMIVHARPKIGITLWLISVGFVPIWFGVTFSFYFYPASLVGIFVLFVTLPDLPRRYGLGDLVMSFLFAACLVPMLSGGSSKTTVFVVLTQWILGFLLGRLLPMKVDITWIYGCVAVVFSIVSVGGILGFLLDWNPYTIAGPSSQLFAKWGGLQGRSELLRTEWAFGHSIALGCSIALAIPMALASNFRLSVRLSMTALMLICVALTISRVSMIGASLAVLMSALFQRDRMPQRIRYGIVGLFAVVSAVLAPFVLGIFETAGDEATLSANYRYNLAELIPDLSLIGVSSIANRSPGGDLYFGRFQSIDSQLLLTGLTYGWFALIAGLMMLGGAMLLVLRRKATPPTIAIVAQLPALATVALITQYSMFFWFVAGLSVFSQIERLSGTADRPVGTADHRVDTQLDRSR